MAIKKNQIENKKEGGVAIRRKIVSVPMPVIAGAKGFEEIGQQDIVIPRVKLIQKQSREIDEYEDIKPGNLINSITKEFVADPKKNLLEFIPLDSYKTRIMWIPFSEGGGIECRSDDGLNGTIHGECERCSNSEFGKDGQAPACTLIYNYPSIILGIQEDFPISITMFKTSTGTAKQLNAMVKLAQASGIVECYANVFLLGTIQQEKEGQKYFVFNVRAAGKKIPKDFMKKLDILYNMVKLARQQNRMKVDITGLEEEMSGEDNDTSF